MIKLGHYRKNANKQRIKHRITLMDFDVVLYSSEKDWVTQYDLMQDVTKSKSSVVKSLKYLVDRGFLRIAKAERLGNGSTSRKYVVTPKGRKMVTDFYMDMFPKQFVIN